MTSVQVVTTQLAPLLSEIDSHDYFARLRQQHLIKLGEQQKLTNEEKQKQRRELALSWRKGGTDAFSKVCSRLNVLKAMIMPHDDFRNTMDLLLDLKEAAVANYSHKISPYGCFPLLCSIRDKYKPKNYSIQTNLICWKIVVQKELVKVYDQKLPISERQFYRKTNHPLTTVRYMMRYYQHFIKVDEAQHGILKKKRYTFRKAKEKMDKIYRTQAQCEAIKHCKSIQHYNPKGCGNCGVIFIGGSLDGAVPYVKSIDRDTGVFTLVTLQFEIQTLAREQTVQEALLEKLGEDLAAFEHLVYGPVRVKVQNWWRMVLAYKRFFRTYKSILKSSYYYRIRRLVSMKRDVDANVKEAKVLDVIDYADKYCDILPELQEYIAYQRSKKNDRIIKFSRKFQRKLIVVVEEARERRYLEWLRLQSLPPPIKPIIIKRLIPAKQEKYICFRMECQCRTFLTKERFEIHMKVHQKDDLIRYAKYAHDAEMKDIRGQQEKLFLSNVQDSKQFVEGIMKVGETLDWLGNTSTEEIIRLPQPHTPTTSTTINTTFQSNAFLPVSSPHSTKHSTTSSSSSLASLDRSMSRSTYNHRLNNGAEIVANTINTIQYVPLTWTNNLHHRFNLYDNFANTQTYSLELVSKHADLDAKTSIRLDEAMIRIGTHPSCECPIAVTGEAQREGKISKIHCILYHNNGGEEIVTPSGSTISPRSLTIVDNSSLFGTYVVTLDGALKVPSKISQGMILSNGALLCIGVMRDGPPRLPVVEANGACLVYRFLIS